MSLRVLQVQSAMMTTSSMKISSLETNKHSIQNEGLRPLVTQCPDEPRRPGWFRHLRFFTAGLLLAIIAVRYVVPTFRGFKLDIHRDETPLDAEAVCPKTSAIVPHTHADILKKLETEYASERFHDQAFAWLGGAVKIPYVKNVGNLVTFIVLNIIVQHADVR